MTRFDWLKLIDTAVLNEIQSAANFKSVYVSRPIMQRELQLWAMMQKTWLPQWLLWNGKVCVLPLISTTFPCISEIYELSDDIVNGFLTNDRLSLIFSVELRKKARQLENEIDLKLVSFSKLGTNYSHHNGFKER